MRNQGSAPTGWPDAEIVADLGRHVVLRWPVHAAAAPDPGDRAHGSALPVTIFVLAQRVFVQGVVVTGVDK